MCELAEALEPAQGIGEADVCRVGICFWKMEPAIGLEPMTC
jgi:hypothetical protein